MYFPLVSAERGCRLIFPGLGISMSWGSQRDELTSRISSSGRLSQIFMHVLVTRHSGATWKANAHSKHLSSQFLSHPLPSDWHKAQHHGQRNWWIMEGIIREIKYWGHCFNKGAISSFVYLEIIKKHMEGWLKGLSNKTHLPPNLARRVPSLDVHSGRQEPLLQIVFYPP